MEKNSFKNVSNITGGSNIYPCNGMPSKDEMFNTRGKMLENIQVCLGGRIAEELVFDDITTGASQDIKQATQIAKAMVTKYGMSSTMGMVAYSDDESEVFIGRDLAHARGIS